MRLDHSIDIAAPIERLWALTLDVEGWPDETPTMTSIERLEPGPLTVGSRVRIKQPAQRRRVWTVTSIEPQSRFAWTTRALGTQMTATHSLGANATGATNTLSVELTGPLAPIVGALVRRPIRKAMKIENEGFRRAAERRTTTPAS